jgi:hypothetical protein
MGANSHVAASFACIWLLWFCSASTQQTGQQVAGVKTVYWLAQKRLIVKLSCNGTTNEMLKSMHCNLSLYKEIYSPL